MDIFEMYSFFLYGVFAVYLLMFFLSIKYSDGPLSSVFALICLASALFVLGAALQFNSKTLEEILFFQKLKYFGAPFVPGLWVIFAHRVYFRRKMSLVLTLVILLIPALLIFWVSTNEYHGLYYAGIDVFQTGEYLFSRRKTGPLYLLNVVYAYFAAGFCLFSFSSVWVKSRFRLNNPYFLLLAGQLLSAVLFGLYLAGMTPFWVDMLPVGYFVLAVFCAVAIFKYDILEIKEIHNKEIFSEIKEGLMLVSCDGLLIDYNESAQTVFGWLNEKNRGTPMHSLDSRFNVATGAKNFNIGVGSGNEERIYEFRLTELKEGRKTAGFLYIFLDVTEKMRLIDKLRYMADHDSLTGIFNRGRILSEITKLLSARKLEGRSFSLCMIDVDHFKTINDSYGHIAGNRMLCEFTDICRQVLGERGILGRYGGEEFLALLPDAGAEEAAEIAEKLRAGIEEARVDFEGNSLHVTVSIGVTTAGLSHETIDVLVSRADRALYRAKNSGRNRVSFSGEDGL